MTSSDILQIDIISDVVCPWCSVGYRQLEQALSMTGLRAHLRWHPFELNPNMPAEGQNLTEHMVEKYGITSVQSLENRTRLQQVGNGLGISFNFTDHSKIVNTFQAHQILDWAEKHDKQHNLKLALFETYFADGLDVSDPAVLIQTAGSVGLNVTDARTVLDAGTHAQPVRTKQQFWTSRSISGVPAMVFGGKYLMTGAQGPEAYADMLRRVQQEMVAA